MADPSITKQFGRGIAPDLLALGFAADGPKRYRRVIGDVFQVIFLHVGTRMRREFMIEYCALLICEPHKHCSLAHGGQFPVGSQGTWYRADTPERLEQSLAGVREALPGLLDWLRASETLDGFLGTYAAHCATQPPVMVENGHTSMTMACGAAVQGDVAAARKHAERALAEYEEILSAYRAEFPQAEHWAPESIERVRALIDAIDGGTTDSLFACWREFTRVALKIRG